ncbi:non-homologous end joining protein Ku [Micromonospora sp. NBC_01813]|uniref:non-homologous end joining protein Ku n=1 Tax=Micromonospora sp. NBC_01813 TaxID=2975988 RepID=UPI002DD81934|nr:Ku protein [Micromonospora sp. NBC_01813]WSA11529.1 Ku protein [Micromonospora sp. NBC_01813]
MRAIWKGVVAFGLVSVGVKIYSATEEKSIRFHQVHAADGGRIRYKRVCEIDGQEVAYGDMAKGFDADSGDLVVLDDEDFAGLPLSTSRVMDVVEFVPADQIDPIFYDKAYYLGPDGPTSKPYFLLRDALASSGRVAVVKLALRQREHLATLRVRDNVLLLNTMLWPDEVRVPEVRGLDDEVSLSPQELSMAGSLIEAMVADFEPARFADNYRVALQEVIDAKLEGRKVTQPAAIEQGSAAVDLIAALTASVQQASSRGVEPTPIESARSARSAAAERRVA